MGEKTTKEKLMDSALKLFSTKGFDGTSVDEIAEAIGIKGPNLYNYFKGKEALLDSLITTSEEAYKGNMNRIASTPRAIRSGKDLKEHSLGLLSFTLNNEQAVQMRRLLTIEQFRNERFAKLATKYSIENMVGLYTGIFKEMIKDGLVKDYDPETLAITFALPISEYIALSDRDANNKEDAMKKIENHIDFFVKTFCLA